MVEVEVVGVDRGIKSRKIAEEILPRNEADKRPEGFAMLRDGQGRDSRDLHDDQRITLGRNMCSPVLPSWPSCSNASRVQESSTPSWTELNEAWKVSRPVPMCQGVQKRRRIT